MPATFVKTVSKGSRFNQIYVPKNMEGLIEVGDEVEVTLIKKHVELHYSKGLRKLSHFKENLIKDIFSFVNDIANVGYVFIVGSFLAEKINYNDIDVVLIASKLDNKFEETIYNKVIERINLRFHILAIEEVRFWHLLEICPLTRAMFTNYVCNKPVKINDKKSVDKDHIKFLLMMPYDLLEIKISSRAFYDSLRRLITIERFLKNKSLDMFSINEELEILINAPLRDKIKCNENIEENSIKFLRKLIRAKLELIEELIKDGQKER